MYDYKTQIEPLLNAGHNVAAIAEAFEAEERAMPENYRALQSNEILRWFAGEALYERVERWTESVKGTTDPKLMAILSGVKTLKDAGKNHTAKMFVTPGSEDRQLLDAAASVGAITEDDVKRAVAIGYTPQPITPQVIQSVIDDYKSDKNKWQRSVTAGAKIIQKGGTYEKAKAAME